MKAKLLYLIGGVLACLSIGVLILPGIRANSGGIKNASNLPPVVGSAFPDFKATTLEGREFHFADYKNQAVIINFWATWCPPCREEMPLFQNAFTTYSPDLVVLGINAGEETNLVQRFVEDYQISFPVLLDSDSSIQRQFSIQGFPTTFFLDKGGFLRAYHIGLLTPSLLSGYLQKIGIAP